MTNSHRKLAILGAAILVASTLTAGTAQAYTYTVYVLKTSTSPERRMCWDLVAAGPAQAVRECFSRFGMNTTGFAYDNFCRPYRSSHRTVHKDGTTPQWVYWMAAAPPYENRC